MIGTIRNINTDFDKSTTDSCAKAKIKAQNLWNVVSGIESCNNDLKSKAGIIHIKISIKQNRPTSAVDMLMLLKDFCDQKIWDEMNQKVNEQFNTTEQKAPFPLAFFSMTRSVRSSIKSVERVEEKQDENSNGL